VKEALGVVAIAAAATATFLAVWATGDPLVVAPFAVLIIILGVAL
jgi:hypothetical protein